MCDRGVIGDVTLIFHAHITHTIFGGLFTREGRNSKFCPPDPLKRDEIYLKLSGGSSRVTFSGDGGQQSMTKRDKVRSKWP